MKKAGPLKAGDVLQALFRDRFGNDFADRTRSTAGLFSAWIEIASEAWPPLEFSPVENSDDDEEIPAAAAHSRVREFERGMILVEADHPGWVQILQTKQTRLLESARRRFPGLEIRGISFCLSREPFSIHQAADEAEEDEAFPVEETEVSVSQNNDGGPSGKESYYAARKGLEESIKKRNRLK